MQTKRTHRYWLLFCLAACIVFILQNGVSHGADINLSLKLVSKDDHVTLTIYNSSAVPATIKAAHINLVGKDYPLVKNNTQIAPGSELTNGVTVPLPGLPGTYPLLASIAYYNDGQLVSMQHIGQFYFRQQALLPETCRLDSVALGGGTGKIVLRAANPELWRLVLPDELAVIASESFPDRKVFTIRSTVTGLSVVYPYFAVAEQTANGLHHSAVQRGSITLRPAGDKGRLPVQALAALLALFAATCFFSYTAALREEPKALALFKYASRMLLFSASYLLLKEGDAMVAAVLEHVDSGWLWQPGSALINHLNGPNYRYFFTYAIDLYFAGCLLLLLPCLYYQEREIPLHGDKYASLMLSAASLFSVVRGGKLYWSYTSRLGLLTLGVKLFFLPLLVSWVINNTFHQFAISKSFVFSLAALNAWLVALFIYVDTMLFCFGYMFEAKWLKNEIRSVEPTLLGWVVCLWCYPPFNSFSFRIFDHRLFDISHNWPAALLAVMTCLITLLWGVFAWASVALGSKASNLTNRGIVSSGPYRYVRHPAYSAKLVVFYIQGVFLGQFFLGMMIGLTIIYMLRAWTEERHLSLDPDYLAYKEQVKWRFIPGVL